MTQQLAQPTVEGNPNPRLAESTTGAALIVNADDWGRTPNITDRIAECVRQKAVSSASAMVFMEDSERAAAFAQRDEVDTGLHLNLTTEFSSPSCPSLLRERQRRLARFLRAFSVCPAIFHPGMARTFDYVVKAQLEEYARLYRRAALRIDGHHHMHLCANVQYQKLLPPGTVVRRNFSFAPGEKNVLNRLYRQWQDRRLAKYHRMTNFFFSLLPIDQPGRLEKIVRLAKRFSVEIETHPENHDEYEFLMGGALIRLAGDIRIAEGYLIV